MIALGMIWYGVGVFLEKKTDYSWIIGLVLIFSGGVMRKTTLLLAGILVIGLCIYLIFFLVENRSLAKGLHKKVILLFFICAVISGLTPGFLTSILRRDNEFFYLPFQVNLYEYLGNLISMNGLIAVLIALSPPLLIFAYRKYYKALSRSTRVILIYFSSLPFVFTLIWMTTLRQATDHHMVQWVPTYFAICASLWLGKGWQTRTSFSLNLRIVSVPLIVLLSSVSVLPILMKNTPFASSSNAVFRPIAHSVSPIQRDDFNELLRLQSFLSSIKTDMPISTISVLNESHEMNAGILKTALRKANRSDILVLPVGGIDFRDDPGLNRIANSDYLVVSNPFVGIIPKYQKLLSSANSTYQKLEMGEIGKVKPNLRGTQ